MTKKIIKLINNERLNTQFASKKACEDSTATDVCTSIDAAHCTTYAYDYCSKDYAACYAGADDTCSYYSDHTVCNGPGAEDNESSPN